MCAVQMGSVADVLLRPCILGTRGEECASRSRQKQRARGRLLFSNMHVCLCSLVLCSLGRQNRQPRRDLGWSASLSDCNSIPFLEKKKNHDLAVTPVPRSNGASFIKRCTNIHVEYNMSSSELHRRNSKMAVRRHIRCRRGKPRVHAAIVAT